MSILSLRLRSSRFMVGAAFTFFTILAIAATAAQVADAIRNSSTASAWLRENADAVGRLAMFESGGRLDAFNSCCHGVLQVHRDNIQAYAGVSPEVFRSWGLQEQIDVWGRIMSEALQSRPPRNLIGLGTFDGREVDGDLVLACVQLGVGNCQRMINSGSCNGFADANGTTICRMADRIRGNAGYPGGSTGNTGGGTTNPGTGGAGSAGGSYKPSPDPCIRDGDGCMSMTAAMESGFQSGSGVSMRELRMLIFASTTALVIVIMISLLSGLWRNYANGVIEKAELIAQVQKATMIVLTFYVAMSLF